MQEKLKLTLSGLHFENFLTQHTDQEILTCHMKIKKPYVHFIITMLLIENECSVSYIHFLSKIVFMIKWTFKVFYFHVTNQSHLGPCLLSITARNIRK